MDNEHLIHGLIIDHLKRRFRREYSEIKVNAAGDPDLTLSNHGLVLAVVEVETESSITPEKAGKWKDLAQPGTKLILMVPKSARVKVMEILWQKGIADRVGVGTYDIAITMP
ncbi:MAG: hypothetical protein HQL09_01090 [Nitrospirae bacterium]|nr:hypothetical protein [Nitrospirota bacterium]